ncbi:MAG TPA: 3'-5' exonuclease [Bacteriovoracaceae bacterium]|nr:3'-5' exonuclease [Bacteriovoracaceae bacterium]
MGKRYVICDIEATGLDLDKDIIEVALITFEDDKIIEVYETLVNPLRSVPEFIQNLTMISPRDLAEAPKFYDIADALRMRLEGSVFVSHNTDFDLGLLKKKYQELGQELLVKDFCTLKVSQEEIPGLTSYNLDALCSFFRIKIEHRHRAIGDAMATLALFKELSELRLKIYPKILFHPHHEKSLKKLPQKAGLLYFKNDQGTVIRFEATSNLEKTARTLLEVRPQNRELLEKTHTVEGEVTGSALIAEFKKHLFYPVLPKFMIEVTHSKTGEKNFKIGPFRKGRTAGLWFFQSFDEARSKFKLLEGSLKDHRFAYRDSSRSKEEVIQHNYKLEQLSKEAKFPTENLVILGEGKTLGEKSLILIRDGQVQGYGYTQAPDEDIYAAPQLYLTKKIRGQLGANLLAINYIRILKNLRHKTEGWRSLSEHP